MCNKYVATQQQHVRAVTRLEMVSAPRNRTKNSNQQSQRHLRQLSNHDSALLEDFTPCKTQPVKSKITTKSTTELIAPFGEARQLFPSDVLLLLLAGSPATPKTNELIIQEGWNTAAARVMSQAPRAAPKMSTYHLESAH